MVVWQSRAVQTLGLKRLRHLLARFPARRILVLGDAMLDQYVWGTVSRISAEAPVPIVEVQRETFVPGGAANTVRNISALGGRAEFLSVVGADAGGDRLEELLRAEKVGTRHLLRQAGRPTALKTRVIAQKQQVVRIDREDRSPPPDDVTRRLLAALAEELPRADAVLVADYAKGLLTQGLFDRAARLCRRRRTIFVVDPKPSRPLRMRGMTAIKPNRAEAYAFAGLPAEVPLEQVGARLLQRWRPQYLLISLGPDGLALFQPGHRHWLIPTMALEVFDVSGAGDTTSAAFTLALAAGATPLEAAMIANHAAGVVVGKVGTATVTPQELIASFEAER